MSRIKLLPSVSPRLGRTLALGAVILAALVIAPLTRHQPAHAQAVSGQLYQKGFSILVDPGNGFTTETFQIPAGNILRIDRITAEYLGAPQADIVITLTTLVNGAGAEHFMPLPRSEANSSQTTIRVLSEHLGDLYAGPGNVVLKVQRFNAPRKDFAQISIAGELIPTP